jgi:Tfp pilus assembly PilM family ATPase
MARYIGIDVGAEAIKVVELRREHGRLTWVRRELDVEGLLAAGA